MSSAAVQYSKHRTPQSVPAIEHDREVPPPSLMHPLSPDLFRRNMGFRLFEAAAKALLALEKGLLGDYAVSAKAAKYHIAQMAAEMIDRPDLSEEFGRARDEAVLQARTEFNLRRAPRPKQPPKTADRGIGSHKPHYRDAQDENDDRD